MFRNFYTVFYLGPIPIQVWGFFVALGMALSFVIIWKRSKKLGLDAEKNIDIGVWIIIFGLIGARLVHVFLYEPAYFLSNPMDIIKIWQGGLSSFGGLFGALLAVFVFVKRQGEEGESRSERSHPGVLRSKREYPGVKKILQKDLMSLADLLAFSALYGWIVGRVGCVMIHDHLGHITESIFSVQTIDGLRYEMAFIEIIFLIPLAIIFYIFRHKQMRKGYFINILFIYYGVLRFGLDFLRATDIVSADIRYLGLTPAQYFGIVLAIVGVYIMKRKT